MNLKQKHNDPQERDPVLNNDAVSPIFERLERLYDQSEAIKMMGLQKFLSAGRDDEVESGQDMVKLSQMVLKSIELQLRIIGESVKSGSQTQELPSELSELWEVLLETPSLGSLLRRNKIKDDLLKRLQAKAQEE